MRTSRAVKLILREHVEHLGERGQVVSVKPGFARNYLLPRGLAYEATPGNQIMVEHQRRVWAARDAKELEQAKALAAAMGEVKLSVTKKAGESGTLYGSVTKAEVATLLREKGFEVSRKAIGPDDPIKSVGEFEVTVKVHRDVVATVQLEVIGEYPPSVREPVEERESPAEESEQQADSDREGGDD